jgi:LysM repeat protein
VWPATFTATGCDGAGLSQISGIPINRLDRVWITVSPRCDSFKHLYYVARCFFGASLDSGLLALVDHRTSVRSNGCTESRAQMRRHPRNPPVRLTRRGRVVLFCLLLAVAGTLITLVSAPGQAADPPGPAPVLIVQPGDTLWDIATRHGGPHRRDATIEEIRRLNHLDGYSVDAGQRLTLPRRR